MLTPVLGLRLLCGVVCCTAGVLTLIDVSAGSKVLVSVVSRLVTEFGYCLVIPVMLSLMPGWLGSSAGRLSAVLNVFAVMLLAAPPARAWETAQLLPESFARAFGTETRTRHRFAADPRDVPFVLSELVRPVQAGPVRYEQRLVETGGDGEVTLDIYRPPYTHKPIPGVIVIHGESWPGGVARELVALNGYLAARDYLVIAMNNPLRAGRHFSTAREDILSTVAYVKAHASELGLDPTQLALMGRSVAGHLPLLVAYTAHDPAIRGVIAFYAPSDFTHWYAQARSGDDVSTRATLGEYLGGSDEPSLDLLDAASPIRHVRGGVPPTLLVHGLRDRVVPPDQSELLSARLEQADVQHVLVRLPWATHGCDLNFGGPCGQITTYAVERFLDSVMADRHVQAQRRKATPAKLLLAPGTTFNGKAPLADPGSG